MRTSYSWYSNMPKIYWLFRGVCLTIMLFAVSGGRGGASEMRHEGPNIKFESDPHLTRTRLSRPLLRQSLKGTDVTSTLQPSQSLQFSTRAPPAPTISSLKARLLLVAVSSLYGIDYSLNKVLQRSLAPEIVCFLKYGFAAGGLASYCKPGSINKRSVRVGFELAVWCLIYALSVSNAIKWYPASKVSFFATLGVIMPPIYDEIIRLFEVNYVDSNLSMKQISLGRWWRSIATTSSPFVSALFALIGALSMQSAQNPDSGESGKLGYVWRDALLLVSPLASSMCYWRSERMAAQQQYDATGVSTIMLSAVALLAAILSLYRYGLPISVQTVYDIKSLLITGKNVKDMILKRWEVVFALLISSLLVTAWGTLAEQNALCKIPAAEALVVLSLEPLFTTLFSYILLNEAPTKRSFFAGFLIVVGCLWKPLMTAITEF